MMPGFGQSSTREWRWAKAEIAVAEVHVQQATGGYEQLVDEPKTKQAIAHDVARRPLTSCPAIPPAEGDLERLVVGTPRAGGSHHQRG